jgi:hypothetical protein
MKRMRCGTQNGMRSTRRHVVVEPAGASGFVSFQSEAQNFQRPCALSNGS